VLAVTQVEGSGCSQAGAACEIPKELRELLIHLGMSARRRRIHVQHTIPYLVEQILPELFAALDERSKHGGWWIEHERGHRSQGYRRRWLPQRCDAEPLAV
jgi:hypothetical protein